MSEVEDLFDKTMTRPLSDFVTVESLSIHRGDVIRRIESENNRGLATLKELCLTHGAWDTLSLVETEQAKRLNRKILFVTIIGVLVAGLAALFSGLALRPRADSHGTPPPPVQSPQSK